AYTQIHFHLAFIVEALLALVRHDGLVPVGNALMFLFLLSLPLVNGLLFAHALKHRTAIAEHPLPFVALFYALVALHHQNATYLAFAIGPVALGFLWLSGAADRHGRMLPTLLVVGAAAAALSWNAAQPASRSIRAMVRGEPSPEPWV